jgi:hypothetical protein
MARRRASDADDLTFRPADSVFNHFKADFVALTTFGFDPIFFEKRLLRTKAIGHASRIVIFMDEREWFKVQRCSNPARHLNTRYLVVPVGTPRGVFHPKLVLLLGEEGIAAGCHSANLTRPGYGGNLELTNQLVSTPDAPSQEALAFSLQVVGCMNRIASSVSETTAGSIAHEWMEAVAANVAASPEITEARSDIELWHTAEEPLWDRMVSMWKKSPPNELVIMSPFYDRDQRLLYRVAEVLPDTPIRIIAQNRTSTFNPAPLEAFPSPLSMTTLESSRRLHAKSIMWRHGTKWTALCGSANWTSNAIEGLNMEASMLIPDAVAPEVLIQDKRLQPSAVDPMEFEPGEFASPENEESETRVLIAAGATLSDGRTIRIQTKAVPSEGISAPTIDLWFGKQTQPGASLDATVASRTDWHVVCPENLDLRAVQRISIRGMINGRSETSDPVWIIRRDLLEHEGESRSSSERQRQIRDNGDGLEHYLDEIARTTGPIAVAEYLRSLSIRFHAGDRSTLAMKPAFRVQARDSFRGEEMSDWWIGLNAGQATLQSAIADFVDRHYRKHLCKHAKSGNLNGLQNFIDVLGCLTRLLQRWHTRTSSNDLEDQVVTGGQLIGRCCAFIEVLLDGSDSRAGTSPGYVVTMIQMMRGDRERLRSTLQSAAVLPIACALLRVAQLERARREASPTHPASVLTDWFRRIQDVADSLDLEVDLETAIPVGLTALGFTQAELTGLQTPTIPDPTGS